jgi:hypothetical protein
MLAVAVVQQVRAELVALVALVAVVMQTKEILDLLLLELQIAVVVAAATEPITGLALTAVQVL